MPTKSARVSTECTIATHYYNNDTVHSDMKVKSVMLKFENDLDSLYERQVSFIVCLFIWHRNANLESKLNQSGVYGHLRYAIT